MIHCIESHHFSTAKARRTRREKVMNKTKEAIEQTAEQAVDATLKVHVHWGRACSNRLIKDGIKRMVNGL
jgi:hypothetical protein